MSGEDKHKSRIAKYPEAIREAHKHSSSHRKVIEESDICGCFYCCSTFSPDEIKDWVDENNDGIGQCALCPRCGIDSVIGSFSGFPINEEFLKEMNHYWF